jgi:hypothetical protein
VNIQDFAPISPSRFRRIKWRGERTYLVLTNSFSLRWNEAIMAERIDYVLGAFAVPSPAVEAEIPSSRNGVSTYSLVDLGPSFPRRYRLYLADRQLLASRSPHTVVNSLLVLIIDGMQRIKEYLLIHAGSVVTPRGDGVLFPGESGSGKTTLVAALIRDGFKFLSDELGVIDPETGLAHPYPRAMNFKDPSLPRFPEPPAADDLSLLGGRERYLRAEEIRPGIQALPTAVRYVIFPRYRDGAVTEVGLLSPAETVKELWANVVNRSPYGSRAVGVLAEMARRARGCRLVSGDVGEAVRAVTDLTEAS